jgi:hypothetical protein
VSVLTTDPFWLPRGDVDGMTYAEGWDVYLGPMIARQTSQPVTPATSPAQPQVLKGGFNPQEATKEEFDSFLGKMCGDNVYKGKRWWVPGEVPGIKRYQGPGKESVE